jgi:spermidine synthase
MGKLTVWKSYNGELSLRINGYVQGISRTLPSFQKSYWYRLGIAATDVMKKRTSGRALVLGLGADATSGTLRDACRDISIDIVEIDQDVIDVAVRYFGCVRDTDTRIFCGDAYALERIDTLYSQYDCIIVDIFNGKSGPLKTDDKAFLSGLITKISNDGRLLINWPANSKKTKQEAERLVRSCADAGWVILDCEYVHDPRGYRNYIFRFRKRN